MGVKSTETDPNGPLMLSVKSFLTSVSMSPECLYSKMSFISHQTVQNEGIGTFWAMLCCQWDSLKKKKKKDIFKYSFLEKKIAWFSKRHLKRGDVIIEAVLMYKFCVRVNQLPRRAFLQWRGLSNNTRVEGYDTKHRLELISRRSLAHTFPEVKQQHCG